MVKEFDIIDVHAKLYDYTVNFISDVKKQISEMGEESTYIIDSNVYKLYAGLFDFIPSDRIFLMEAIEEKKTMDTVMDIIAFWKANSVKKDWKVICFGGGITQDVTTVASDLYLRNLEWYFFPTTLLAMCDSCIGGKCGINFEQYKNQIGVFYPPRKIFINIDFLSTLTQEDYLNGWGEILKFALTKDPAFYDEMKCENAYIPCNDIAHYIYCGLQIKKEIIEEDEYESDLRRVLNYGHTFGHALEAYTHNRIPHGKGVIWGIDVVNYIAWKENKISREYYYDIKGFIKRSFLRDEIVIDDPQSLFEIIRFDKKVKGDQINLAILDGESHLCIYPMRIDAKLYDLFIGYLEETHDYYMY